MATDTVAPLSPLETHLPVEGVDIGAGVARGVQYRHSGRAVQARGEMIVLAASALFNPHILLRSGVTHRLLGKRLHEQLPVDVCMDLDGVDAYDGSVTRQLARMRQKLVENV